MRSLPEHIARHHKQFEIQKSQLDRLVRLIDLADTVIKLQIDAPLRSGKLYLGTMSGELISLFPFLQCRTVDRREYFYLYDSIESQPLGWRMSSKDGRMGKFQNYRSEMPQVRSAINNNISF